MKILTTSALAAILSIAAPALSQAQETMTKEKLVGPWQLVSFKATAGDKVSYPLGEHPGGYIEITPTRYWVMLVDPARKPPAATTPTDRVYLANENLTWPTPANTMLIRFRHPTGLR